MDGLERSVLCNLRNGFDIFLSFFLSRSCSNCCALHIRKDLQERWVSSSLGVGRAFGKYIRVVTFLGGSRWLDGFP